ncbi:MAG TPA: hypothetical protein VHE37_06120 [Nevskiaceae bacterium]|nr:hypothetical protein [Nevskiaceae bacterium]
MKRLLCGAALLALASSAGAAGFGAAAPATGPNGTSNSTAPPAGISAPTAPSSAAAGGPVANPYSATPGAPYAPGQTPATLPGAPIPLPNPPPLPGNAASTTGAGVSGGAMEFNQLDTSGDGSLSQQESGMTQEQFNARDANHDGRLSPLEFSNPLP